jgi:hypothetical protein
MPPRYVEVLGSAACLTTNYCENVIYLRLGRSKIIIMLKYAQVRWDPISEVDIETPYTVPVTVDQELEKLDTATRGLFKLG